MKPIERETSPSVIEPENEIADGSRATGTPGHPYLAVSRQIGDYADADLCQFDRQRRASLPKRKAGEHPMPESKKKKLTSQQVNNRRLKGDGFLGHA